MAEYTSTTPQFTHFGGIFSSQFAVGASSNSTTGLRLIQAYTVEFTEAAVSSGPSNANSTFTVTGATTNALYLFTPRLLLTAGYGIGSVRCSTANEVVINWTGNSASSLSGSTNRGTLLQFGV